MKKALIYTDGSCRYFDENAKSTRNKEGVCVGPGSWAFVIVDEEGQVIRRSSGFLKKCTSNTAELTAIIEALRLASTSTVYKYFDLYSDSRYCVDGVNSWIHKWVKTKFKDVKNDKYWKELWQLFSPMKHNSNIIWVKGHNGNKFNEMADAMCQEELQKGLLSIKEEDVVLEKNLNAIDFVHLLNKNIEVEVLSSAQKKSGTMFSLNLRKNTIGILIDGSYEYIFYLSNANLKITEI